MADAEPVGLAEIAQRLGVKRATAATWHWRGLLPDPPRWTVSGSPAWDWELDIAPWARRTGRLHDDYETATAGPSDGQVPTALGYGDYPSDRQR